MLPPPRPPFPPLCSGPCLSLCSGPGQSGLPALGVLAWAQSASANAIDSAAIHPWNLSTQTRSLNHLISAGEDGGREGQPKALCSREVHRQLDTPGLLDRKNTRRGPL